MKKSYDQKQTPRRTEITTIPQIAVLYIDIKFRKIELEVIVLQSVSLQILVNKVNYFLTNHVMFTARSQLEIKLSESAILFFCTFSRVTAVKAVGLMCEEGAYTSIYM